MKVNSTEFDYKYLVCKVDDVHKYLTQEEVHTMKLLMDKIMRYRRRDGKKPSNNYLVVNAEESYAHAVAEIMQLHGHYKETKL